MQKRKPKSSIRPGDLFRLGPHRLLCGRAEDKKGVERLAGKDRIRAVISDPPYGISYVKSKAGFGQNIAKPKDIEGDGFQSEEEYREFTGKWLEAVVPYLEAKNSAYIFNCDKMVFALKRGMEDAGLKFSQLLVWVKNHSVIGRKDYLPQHELIAYGWHGTHLFAKSKDKSVLLCPKPGKSKLHPTMKPVSLLRRLILNSTNVGDVVYDPFLGSGSLIIACQQTSRVCLGIETDPEYCKTAIDRFEKLTGIGANKITE